MRRCSRWAWVGLLVAGLALGACARDASSGGGEEESYSQSAAKVEAIRGSDLSRVTISQRAAARLGLETTRVRAAGGGRTVVPYDSVLYDEQGETWVYTSAKPLTFVRQRIDVERIEGDRAVLRTGPRAGTTIVTVGAAELLGAELGVGGD
jgi:hypothetical protein